MGTHELPAVHSAQSHSSPGSACSTPAAGCCRSRNSRGPQTGSWGLVKELPAQGACPPATCPSPRGGCSWSPRPRRDRGNLSCLLPAQNKETHPDTRRWPRAPIQLALYTDSEVLWALSRPEKIPEASPKKTPTFPFAGLTMASEPWKASHTQFRPLRSDVTRNPTVVIYSPVTWDVDRPLPLGSDEGQESTHPSWLQTLCACPPTPSGNPGRAPGNPRSLCRSPKPPEVGPGSAPWRGGCRESSGGMLTSP